MKTKKFERKLNLNKSTVANLDNSEKSKIKGGVTAPPTESRCLTLCNSDPCCTQG